MVEKGRGNILVALRRHWLAGLIVVFPVLLFCQRLDAFPFPPAPGAYSDQAVAHYPNAVFLRQEIIEHGTIPLWSPAILGGYPFFANPLSGLMYPPGWLALLLPLPAGFNLIAALHLILGGFGMAEFMRTEGLSRHASMLSGLIFVLSSKLIAHYGAGHLTLLYAVSWTPWLLWASRQQSEQLMHKSRWLPPGIFMALILLADVRWGAYALLVWWPYSIVHSQNKLSAVKMLTLQTLLAILLAAPLWAPLLEYARLSTRDLMTAKDVLVYSLPPVRILTGTFPDFGGFHEWVLYPGGGVLSLSVLGMLWVKSSVRVRFWIGLALFSLIFSLGEYIPGAQIIAQLPLVSLLRVPSRALFLLAICLAALTGISVDILMKGLPGSKLRIARLILVGLNGYVLTLCIGIVLISQSLPIDFHWGAAAVLLGSICIFFILARSGETSREIWFTVLVCTILVDLFAVDRSLITFRSQKYVLGEGAQVASWLSKQNGLFRIYSPSYSLPQQTAARYGLQLADGVDPLQLQSYTEFMKTATGIARPGYSVTLPSFGDKQPEIANAGFVPDANQLGLLNVRYVVSEYDLPSMELVHKKTFGTTRIYENSKFMPRAWVQVESLPLGQGIAEVHVVKWRPNQIDISASGPGMLVLSEISYPGWRARLDGKPAEVIEVGGLLRAVRLDSGDHEVVFSFHPRSLYVGLSLGAIGLLIYFARLVMPIGGSYRPL